MSSKYRSNDLPADNDSHVASADGTTATVELFAFDQERLVDDKSANLQTIADSLGKYPITWINVEGASDFKQIEQLGKMLRLHELAIEDIVNKHQRAKVDEYDGLLFIVIRMVELSKDHVKQEQICIVLGNNFVATFQESEGGDSLNSVRDRIRNHHVQLANRKPDWLMYAMIDAIVDGYFPVIESLGEILEQLEDEILERINRLTPARIVALKRQILTVRRNIWPVREALNVLIRDDVPHVSAQTKAYLRDCYDHVVRIMDLVESAREMSSDLMDLYLSSTSNRMNEVMKVLTMITLLFMPPTLVAGVYGMNFQPASSPYNMPELHWRYGYPFALALMAITMVCVYVLAKSRGWLQENSPTETRVARTPRLKAK